MKAGKKALQIISFFLALTGNAFASERRFTYTYEPETMVQGAHEFEQWITFRGPRNAAVGQKNFSRWDFREELEFGVNDNYTLALVWDEKVERFKDPSTGREQRESAFEGFGLENKVMIWDPADHSVGLSLYFEPQVSDEKFELEGKIILGQRIGKDWKWALNITHAAEWTEDFNKVEGELEFTTGLTKELNKNWSLGVEFRNHNELPEYEKWENTAFFLGPVMTYRRENWWITLTALAQVYGKNYGEDLDGKSNFELQAHEYANVRCIIGIEF